MSTAIITRTYQDHAISYNGEGWFNATEAASKFDKRLDHWLDNKETKEYIAVLAEDSNTPLSGYLKTKRRGHHIRTARFRRYDQQPTSICR